MFKKGDIWNKYSYDYDNLNSLLAYKELLEKIISIINKYCNQDKRCKIVDLGCGTGSLSISLSNRFKKSQIISIDNSDSMLAVLKRKIDFNKIENIDVLKADIKKLTSYKNLTDADVYIMNNVLYTIGEKEKFLENLSKLLRKKSILIISDPKPVMEYKYVSIIKKQFSSIKIFWQSLRLIPSFIRIYVSNKEIDKKYVRYSKNKYIEIFHKSGYDILHSEYTYADQANLFVLKKNEYC